MVTIVLTDEHCHLGYDVQVIRPQLHSSVVHMCQMIQREFHNLQCVLRMAHNTQRVTCVV